MKKLGYILVLLVGALSPDSRSQSVVTAGDIRGVASDSAGALVPADTIILLARSTGQTSARKTNDAGIFVFASQPVGTYSLEVTAA